jgi:two-component system, LytTR family, sensor kinase
MVRFTIFESMRVIIHIALWALLWLWMTTVYLYDTVDFLNFLQFNLMRLPVIIAATYAVIHYVVYKNLAITFPRYVRGTIIFLLIFAIASLIDRFIIGLNVNLPTLQGEQLEYLFINPLPIYKNSFLLFSILGMASAVQFFIYSIEQQKVIHELKEEKLQNELSFLRSQVNPHFLFNVFNNLYSMASRSGQQELAKGLSGVAGLMRYLTYESNIPCVSLQKEIELLKSFIELQNLRIGDSEDVLINFKLEGEFVSNIIAPILLLPLVENAFKHGLTPGEACSIDIVLKVSNDHLEFVVTNKIPKEELHSKGGLGLENLRLRLERIYPKRHQLEISQQGDFYKARLWINLKTDTKAKPIL